MTESGRHKRNKHRLMLYSFKDCRNCNDKGHFGSSMQRRIELMGHMVVVRMVVTDQIKMTWSKMENCWTLWIGEVIDMGTIPVLSLTCIMIVIIIILIGGVIGDTCE